MTSDIADAAGNWPEETPLLSAMSSILPKDVLGGCRWIRPGDELRLLPEEVRSIPSQRFHARRASGAGRVVARDLLTRMGAGGQALPRGPFRMPLWPAGSCGSIAHDEEVAVAVVTRSSRYASLGIDVEPALPLPDDVAELVVTDTDRIGNVAGTIAPRLVFSLKEAVYKAAFPLDRQVLGYEHIAVDLLDGHARAGGRRLQVNYCLKPRIIALAFIGAEKG